MLDCVFVPMWLNPFCSDLPAVFKSATGSYTWVSKTDRELSIFAFGAPVEGELAWL